MSPRSTRRPPTTRGGFLIPPRPLFYHCSGKIIALHRVSKSQSISLDRSKPRQLFLKWSLLLSPGVRAELVSTFRAQHFVIRSVTLVRRILDPLRIVVIICFWIFERAVLYCRFLPSWSRKVPCPTPRPRQAEIAKINLQYFEQSH